MAAWFAIGVVIVVLLMLGARGFVNADPKFLARALKIVGAVVCGGLALFFLLRGRIDAAMLMAAGAAASLGYLPRGLIPFSGLFHGRGLGSGWQRARTGNEAPADAGMNAGSGQQSGVETHWLRMQLDHGTGRMDGEVLQGRYAGRRLSSLGFEDLILLLRDCRAADNQGAALLESYLDRTVGEDWRERAASGDAGEAADAMSGAASGGAMTRDQAWDVLGLKPGASDVDIRAAHRRLMKKFHPDQGGSTYLAAQINRAKDLLLGE